MNIDVKETADGQYFYSFALEKGTAPHAVLAEATEENSATVPTNDNLPQNDGIVNTNSMQNGGKDTGRQNLFAENGGLSGIELYRLGRALIGAENAGEVDFDGSVPGAQLAARYISTQEAMKLLERSGVKISKAQAENLKNHHNQRAELAHAIARTFGVNVRFGGVQPGALAQYEKSTNTIYLNPSEKVSVMRELAEGHEIVHAIEQTPNYAKISQLVIENVFGGVDSEAYTSEASRIDALYNRMGKNLSSEELQQEVVAEYFRTKVFKDAKSLTDFIIENHETLGKEFFLNLKGISDKVKKVFNEKILGKTGDVPTPPLSDQILTEFATAMNQHRRDRNREIVGQRLDNVAEGYGLVDAKSSVESGRQDLILESIQKSFGIDNINDFVHVQKSVLKTLNNEGFFDDEGGKSKTVINAETGMIIEITPKGIKETFGNGKKFEYLGNELKRLKLATVRNLPEIISQGLLVSDNNPNYHNVKSSLNYAYFDFEEKIGEKNVVIRVSVRKSPDKNKFWFHHVFAINKNTENTPAEENTSNQAQIELGTTDSIAQNPDDVKKKSLATWNSVQGLYDDAVPESSVSEIYNDSVPDEAFSEQARLEAEEFLEAPDINTQEDIEKRYQHERDLFDGALKDVKIEQLSNTEYLKAVSGDIVKAHEIFKNVRRRADNVIFLNHTTAIDKMHSTIYN